MADGTWAEWGPVWVEGSPGSGSHTACVQQRVQWQCEAVLCGEQGHPWGRFGAALTVLGDVNGDKLSDVAIGAPGEQENRGAVYLFHGASESSISPSHSQVRPLSSASSSPSSFPCPEFTERSFLSLSPFPSLFQWFIS